MGTNPANRCRPIGDELLPGEEEEHDFEEIDDEEEVEYEIDDEDEFDEEYEEDEADDDSELDYNDIEEGPHPPVMTREMWEQGQRDVMAAACDQVKGIITGDRNRCYGAPFDNHTCTAKIWSAYLERRGLLVPGGQLDAVDVTDMMDGLKISRNAHWRQRDNAVDTMGYAANSLACEWAMQNPITE